MTENDESEARINLKAIEEEEVLRMKHLEIIDE